MKCECRDFGKPCENEAVSTIETYLPSFDETIRLRVCSNCLKLAQIAVDMRNDINTAYELDMGTAILTIIN